jgi:D-alanyl-D-alanine carboxypeptidase/D-alanyl-D-alanine-endopeptidase (penicillin-binding protein 4)
VPPGATRLVVQESPPLGDLLYGLNRYSNNFMAEMLLRSMGGSVLGPPGTSAKGVTVIRRTLAQLGIPDREVVLDSGSGLSRACRVSARAFGAVLVDAYNDHALGPEFLASMAVSSREGTLKKRFRQNGVTVRGKTGTLKDVVAFSGYVGFPGGRVFAATVLLDGVRQRWDARAALDALLEQLPYLAARP